MHRYMYIQHAWSQSLSCLMQQPILVPLYLQYYAPIHTVAGQLEAIGMMDRNATIFLEHPCTIPHSSQFVWLMDRSIG